MPRALASLPEAGGVVDALAADETHAGAILERRTRAEIEASVRQTLREAARRNEIGLGYVRMVWGGAAIFSWVVDLLIDPWPYGWVDRLTTSALFAASALFVYALRTGWYWDGLRFAVPIFDAVTIFGQTVLNIYLFGSTKWDDYGLRTTLALGCAILALTGCIRLSPLVALLTTALAVAVYGAVTGIIGWRQNDLLNIVPLLAIGYLGFWLTKIVRDLVTNEVAGTILRAFLPAGMVENAIRDPLALVTEPRSVHVTIVVTDVRGFTSFSEATAPALVFEVLNAVQGTLADIVRRHAGTVDKFTGDGMLAVFGLSGGDHARHALAAVADIRMAVQQLQTKLVLRAPLDLRLGMGVHSGAVLVGCIGSAMRLEFTVIGDVVNTAFRLQDLCKDLKSDVLVSHDTLRMCGDGMGKFRSLGHVAIRGRMQDLEVFALD